MSNLFKPQEGSVNRFSDPEHTSFIEGDKAAKHALEHAPDGDPKAILDAVDKFSNTNEDIIHIGSCKGPLIDEQVHIIKPKVIVELGTYIGYSAIRLAYEALKVNKEVQLHSYDIEPKMVETARKMVSKAGLSSTIHIHHGEFKDLASELRESLGPETYVDLILLDHWKPSYTPDTQKIIDMGLVRPGTCLIADNCIIPGAPEFVEYIQQSPEWDDHMVRIPYREGAKEEDGVVIAIYRG
ncbi:MAG: S-adenosyl-L-methionine-dependent methyltransferase [Piptocephalis tieghemiana]|nr:MAG: S-adenosyl-L-methionine-dependent methyltransferase [Piptocephalis tieghemiana]